MSEYPLLESRTATLNANGEALIIGVGPVMWNESWEISLFSVNTTSRCKFYVYRGTNPQSQYQVDATAKGELDTSKTDIKLQPGEKVSFQWTNGTVGAIGTIRIEGLKKLRGY